MSLGPLDGAFTNLVVANDLVITNGGLSLGGVAIASGFSASVAGLGTNPTLTVGGSVRLTGSSGLALGVNGQNSNIVLTVGTDMLVDGSRLALGGQDQAPRSMVSVGNTLTMTNGGSLTVYSGLTNAVATNYGALVSVVDGAGAVRVGATSWIYLYSQSTNGGSVLFRVGSLAVAANGGFDADNKGYAKTY